MAGLAALAGCAGHLDGAVSEEARDHWTQTYDPRTQGRALADVEREFNLFRGRWWNYYARGAWFLELGYPERAAEDFRAAVGQRGDDERDARSYGMHFWEYFPHRELGVSLFETGRYAEAAAELERSLSAEDSARAKVYLNKVRAAILSRSGRDGSPPQITVGEIGAGGLVNTPSFTLRGTAVDDSFVAAIRVAGEPLPVELAAPHLDFSHPLALRNGVNTVRVEADDLVGHTRSLDVRIVLDRLPPVVSIEAATDGGEIECVAADDRGLESVSFGSAEVRCGGTVRCSARLPGGSGRSGVRVPVSARDLAGNVTHAEVDLGDVSSGPGGKGARLPAAAPADWRFAALAGSGAALSDARPWSLPGTARGGAQVAAAMPSSEDRVPPRIELNIPSAGATLSTTDEELILDVRLFDPGGIGSISVNGEPVPVSQPGAGTVAFGSIVALEMGDNNVEVRAADRSGNAVAKRFVIRRVASEILGEEARYSVGVVPPDRKPDDTTVGDAAYDALLTAILREPVRFRLLERDRESLQQILLEQKLSDLAAQGTAVKLGRFISAEGVLFGRVQEDRSGIALELRLVDTETTEILVSSDVYGEGKDPHALRMLANGLVAKIKMSFPVLRGEVVRVDGKQVQVSIGKEQGLRRGMRLLFYRQEQQGALGSQRLVKPGGVVVQARVTEVGRRDAVAELLNQKGQAARAGDRVITK